jgi:hypothetical protein
MWDEKHPVDKFIQPWRISHHSAVERGQNGAEPEWQQVEQVNDLGMVAGDPQPPGQFACHPVMSGTHARADDQAPHRTLLSWREKPWDEPVGVRMSAAALVWSGGGPVSHCDGSGPVGRHGDDQGR